MSWIRLNETNPMVIIISLYDHYWQNCFYFKNNWYFWYNSVNINYKEMRLPPLDLSHWDKSNDINSVKIQSLDAEIIHKNVLLRENHVIFTGQINQIKYSNQIQIKYNLIRSNTNQIKFDSIKYKSNQIWFKKSN